MEKPNSEIIRQGMKIHFEMEGIVIPVFVAKEDIEKSLPTNTLLAFAFQKIKELKNKK